MSNNKPPFMGERVRFNEAFREISRGVAKYKQAEYQAYGEHPIIDQGQGEVAGYADGEVGLCTDIPAIVFGDHTRAVKYLEKPFFAGADGVKILKPLLSDNVRYWYHALRATRIESLGYSRHFKLLKECSFWIHPISDQDHIVRVLDGVLDLICLQEERLSLLDSLVKSQFVEMFGDKNFSMRSFSSLATSMQNGLSPSKTGINRAKILTLSAITQGSFDGSAWKEGAFKDDPPLDKCVSGGCYYVCRGNGNRSLVGTGEFAPSSMSDLVFPDTMIEVRVKQEEVLPAYLTIAWKQPFTRDQIERSAKTTNGTYKINQKVLGDVEIPVPPLSLQQQFAAFVAEVDKSRFVVQRQIEKLQTLYDSLAQEYFG